MTVMQVIIITSIYHDDSLTTSLSNSNIETSTDSIAMISSIFRLFTPHLLIEPHILLIWDVIFVVTNHLLPLPIVTFDLMFPVLCIWFEPNHYPWSSSHSPDLCWNILIHTNLFYWNQIETLLIWFIEQSSSSTSDEEMNEWRKNDAKANDERENCKKWFIFKINYVQKY